VGQRWGKDQVLEEEIHNWKAANDGIWKNIEKDRKTFNKLSTKMQQIRSGVNLWLKLSFSC
jgi:hypothetical protein